MRYQQFKITNQVRYFKDIPPIEFVNQYLKLFGLKNITDTSTFTRNSLKTHILNEKGEKLINELTSEYLFPHKTKTFEIHNNMGRHKYLTILRYMITFYSYNLFKYEKMNGKNKEITYKILKIQDNYNEILEYKPRKLQSGSIRIQHNVITRFPW